MKEICGSIVFGGEEYEYTARCEMRGSDWYPDRITALDRADGQTLEVEDYDALEDFAMSNAWLLDWCDANGWEITYDDDKSRLTKTFPTGISRCITTVNNDSAPQTMTEPVSVSSKTVNGPSLESFSFPGGIDEMLSDETGRSLL